MKTSLPEFEDMVDHIMLTSELSWPEKITRANLDDWLANFKGEVFDKKYEHNLALWLLTNFVYYNEKEVRHLCKSVYKDFIHSVVTSDYSEGINVDQRLNNIRQTTMFRSLGRSGESGGFITYYFSKENKLAHTDFVGKPTELHKDIKHVVFIDDVTLSSGNNQAIRYLKEDVNTYFRDKRITLLTLIASEKAIETLNKEGYGVINCVTLSERNQCFSSESNVFQLHNEHLEDCKRLASHYGEKLYPKHPLGHKDGQLLFGFFYNTPNNSLPILWADKGGWKPIIKRYAKNYGKTDYGQLGRFI